MICNPASSSVVNHLLEGVQCLSPSQNLNISQYDSHDLLYITQAQKYLFSFLLTIYHYDCNPVAYLLVQSRAILSCSSRFCKYWVAIDPTRGSFGLQSVNREQMDSKTLDTVRAGDQFSLSMSRQIAPPELILQW